LCRVIGANWQKAIERDIAREISTEKSKTQNLMNSKPFDFITSYEKKSEKLAYCIIPV